MNERETVLERLGGDVPVLVISHVNPDGDSVGASLGLARWLRSTGREVTSVFTGGIPRQFAFLPDVGTATMDLPDDLAGRIAVILDTPSPERTGAPAGYFDKAVALVNIDHHPSNTGFGDVRLVDVEASSTALLVHDIVHLSGGAADAGVATLLYAGVLTDTGGFRFGNTDARTFEAAARLVKWGADAPEVARHVYGEQPAARLRLLGMVLASVESLCGGEIAVMTLTDRMREAAGATGENIEGLASYGHLLEDVEVSMLLREQGDMVRVSLRSSGRVDVNRIAAGFGGGGHRAASGILMPGPVDRAKSVLVKAAGEALERGRR